jgi:hypothetical protein
MKLVIYTAILLYEFHDFHRVQSLDGRCDYGYADIGVQGAAEPAASKT